MLSSASCTNFQYGPLKWGCSPWGLKALNADVQLELVTLWPELGQGAAQHVYGDTPRPFARFKELPPKQQQVQLFHLPKAQMGRRPARSGRFPR